MAIPILRGPKKFVFSDTSSFLQEEQDGKKIAYPYDISQISPVNDSTTEFHVNYLKNQFTDLARPNLFKVFLNPPSQLVKDWMGNSLTVLAKSTKFPSMTVKEYVYKRAGQKINIPSGEVEHGDCSITFHNDSDFSLRTMFIRWMRLGLTNWEYNFGADPNIALDGSVIIYQFNANLDPIFACNLTNCWPKSISEIELSQDSEGAEEFTVDFNYSYQEFYKDPKGTSNA